MSIDLFSSVSQKNRLNWNKMNKENDLKENEKSKKNNKWSANLFGFRKCMLYFIYPKANIHMIVIY